MAPLVRALGQAPWADCRTLLTGQHADLVAPILEFFRVSADLDLGVNRPGPLLSDLTAGMVSGLGKAFDREAPDLVLAQGDTTTVLAAALASYSARVPFGHVEAGLRTGRRYAPFPEEGNRVVAGHLASVHFAPTDSARANLLREGIDPASVLVTGNTGIDALLDAARRDPPPPPELDLAPGARLVLVTAHRRESFGAPLRRICEATRALHERHPDVQLLWPVHPNPAVEPVVRGALGGLPRVRLCGPLGYGAFVAVLARSYLVLTDSGGVQEEAPALGKPVLVLRSESERPEAVEAGVARLVGTDPARIAREAARLLCDPTAYRAMARGVSPYGDGRASGRIVDAIARMLRVDDPLRAAG
jgi:UDP-N-acetylglucosamine 2-epimerase (non-hydrolysing)